MLAGCDEARAQIVADRLRGDMPPGLTASAGVATWTRPQTADQLVAEADRAKGDGRDRVCVSGRPDPAG